MILYIANRLPCRSETFVYNEVIALREHGMGVLVASVREPERGLGEERLEHLAAEAIPVYGSGILRLLRDVAVELLHFPLRSIRTLGRSVADAVSARDRSLPQRPKIVVQALAAIALSRRVRTLDVTHIHAHMAHVPTTVAMYCALQLNVGFSFTGHAVDLFPQRTLLYEKLLRARFVACISHWHRQFYQQLVPALADDRLPIVRCGVKCVSDETVPAEPPLVMAVGRLIAKKGFHTLVDALAILRNRSSQAVQCVIIGDGPEGSSLEAMIDGKGLNTIVRLMGARSNSEIRTMLPRAALFVLPCQIDPNGGDRDGIPVALMEAMSSGVCVIAGQLEPINELVKDQLTGLLIAPGDAELLAGGIESLLQDVDRRRTLASQGKQWVLEEFDQAVNVRRIQKQFESMGCR